MKIYISVDMEGIAGVVSWKEQAGKEGYDYARFRKLMTEETNAAIEGALEAGATEIVVNDSHGSMRNLILEDLNPEARLISGSPKPMSMVEGLDGSYDGVLFIGYHSRAQSWGVLNHTYSGSLLEYRVNGMLFGETGMNAALAGAFGVPVIMVAGDDKVGEEAQELLGHLGPLQTVAVKKALGRYAADNLHPEKAKALIRESARKAVESIHEFKPLELDKPVTISLRFTDSGLADGASMMPGTVRVDPVTVEYQAPDYPTALRAAITMLSTGWSWGVQ